MRLTFVHDGPVFFDAEGRYYEFAYHELLQRYSYLADKIIFLMRTKPIDGSRKFTLVPPQIKIVSTPDFKDPKLYLKNRRKAEQIIERCIKRSDHVVLRMPSSNAQIAIKYIEKYHKPYIIECVGCAWDSYWNHSLLGKIYAPYMYLKMKSMIGKADHVYYVTTEFLQKRYPTKGKTVCCSNVVLEPLDDAVLQRRLEKISAFDPKKKIIVGTAAAIDTRYKGHEHVIRSISDLMKAGYDIEYHLAGGLTGPRPDTFLQDLAEKCGVSDRVRFMGSLSAEKMPEYYDHLDLYIQPSKQEGLPRAVIEAMSRGCPVIGTDIAGIPELIQKECLFKKGSDQAVFDAVQSVLEMDLKEIAKENFKTARQYEKDKLRTKRERFYDSFLRDLNVG